jgi:cleavage and polyadenylation specificity factor subunit 1
VDFLGHHVSAEGATPLQSHIAAVQDFPPPTTVREVQGFLGMINFYRRFLPGIARTLAPLTDALKGGRKGAAAVEWSAAMQTAFQAAKEALCQASTLVHPDGTADLSLMVDASETHVGAVLQQRERGSPAWRPLGFFSQKLAAAQTRYSAFDRELLAIYSGIRYFRYMLEGRRFTVYTDHKPLTFALHKQAEPWTARQQRHFSYIAEFTGDIRHVAGSANGVADALSRPPPSAVPCTAGQGGKTNSSIATTSGGLSSTVEALPAPEGASSTIAATSSPVPVSAAGEVIDLAAIAAAQAACASTQQAACTSSLHVKTFEVEGVPLLCDTSTGTARPLVPAPHRRLLFDGIHNLAHPGVRATKRLIKSRFVWPGMGSDIADWCSECQACNRGKVTRHVKAPLQAIAVPDRRFSHLHVDLVGPLPTSQEGYSHLLTVIDRSSRWIEAIPMLSTSAQACADAVIGGWVARFGIPDLITSDRGPQFTSAVWTALCQKLGIRHILTTAYHPQSNGMVERFHRQLKEALRSRECGINWAAHLPWVLMGLRAAPKDDSGISSVELVYGQELRLLGQPTLSTAPVTEGAATPPAVRPALPTRLTGDLNETGRVPAQLEGATHVYVLNGAKSSPLSPPYSGPYVVRRRGPKSFDIFIGGRLETISVDRLKLHRGHAVPVPAAPPVRGRPKRS